MSNSIVSLLVAISFAFILCNFVDARCFGNNRRHCCRQRIDYGRCHKHIPRYAYNVSCGRCVQFDYSGCGGDDNIFESYDDCSSCCGGTGPCPRFTLPEPPRYCAYKYFDGPDSCERPRLDCNCPESTCGPRSCRIGQRCIPERRHRPCNRCPCPQYRCVSDPCYPIASHLRPCEKCLSVPMPSCHREPCPLIAYRENHCEGSYHHRPKHCSVYVECPREGNPCSFARCPAYPRAKCVVDECDCRKHSFVEYDKIYRDDECYYGRRR